MPVITNSFISAALHQVGRYLGIYPTFYISTTGSSAISIWSGQICELTLTGSGLTTITIRKPGLNIHPNGYGSAMTFLRITGYSSGASTVAFATDPVSTIKWMHGSAPSIASDGDGRWTIDVGFIFFSGDCYAFAVYESLTG